MTYTALVRGTPPVGYWKLNGTASAVVGSSATITNAEWTTPPLVSNSASSLIIRSSGASVSILNQYNTFYKNFDSTNMTFEFWFSFNGLFDGSGYLKNFEDSTQYYNNDELNILTIDNGSIQIGSIYYSYLKNTFRFKINGTNNLEAYVPVRNLNNSFYIVANYSKGKLSISANGEPGGLGSVADNSLFPNKNSSSIYFNINGSSLNASAGMNFVIGELAIYDMALTGQDQRKRVLHGLNADKPTGITSILETSYFDFSEKDYHSIYNDLMVGAGFQNNIYDSNNLVFSDNEGIRYHQINDFEMLESAYTGSAIATASGAKFLNANTALVFNQYGTLFGKQRYKTISCQITPTTSSTSYIFSIENCIDNKNSLYVTADSSGFQIGSYDNINASATEYFNLAKNLTISQQYDFAISIDGEDIYVYTDDSSDSFSIPGLAIKESSRLILGNLSDIFTNNTLYIKNLAMSNEQETTFTGFNLTDNKMFMARFTSNFSISQSLKWTKVIPISNYGNEVVGSKITWDGMDNCIVEVSSDNLTWKTMNRGEPIPDLLYDRANKNQLIKVTVPYEYKIEKLNQSFNNLDITLYKSLSFVSDDGDYTFTASADSASLSAYTIKRVPQSILLRQDKFGLYFPQTNNIATGYGVINSSSGNTAAYAADFWVKFDSFSSASNFVISRNNSGSPQYVYVDSTTRKFMFPAGVNLYINGSSVVSNSSTASTGTYYHLFCNFITSSSSTMYLNAKYDGSASVHAHGSYGHLNIWSSSVNSTTASSRYAHFVSNNITTVNDSGSLLWQPSWNTDAVTTASGYRIG